MAAAAGSTTLGGFLALGLIFVVVAQYSVQILLSRWIDAIETRNATSNEWLEDGGEEQTDSRLYTWLYVGSAAVFAFANGTRCLMTALFFLRNST